MDPARFADATLIIELENESKTLPISCANAQLRLYTPCLPYPLGRRLSSLRRKAARTGFSGGPWHFTERFTSGDPFRIETSQRAVIWLVVTHEKYSSSAPLHF